MLAAPGPRTSPARPSPARPSAGPRVWLRDLTLGARLAAGGGSEGRIRTALTALGIGLGVAVLLLAAAVPAMVDTQYGKTRDRYTSNDAPDRPTDRSLLYAHGPTTYHGRDIDGLLVDAEGAHAPHPPGIDRLPAPGHMLVSPALASLLASSPVLRARFPYTIDGTIGRAGLVQPHELYYYAGDRRLATDTGGAVARAAGFGHHTGPPMSPVLQLLLDVMVVVLLLPVAVFVGTAVRLGGERRDRRLAALRLVGADAATTRRIAAGESLAGAVLGLGIGALLFLLGRQAAPHVTIAGTSAYASDIRPDGVLTALVATAVPLAAVLITMAGMRGIVVEPLGVVRRGTARSRRLWWRLAVPALGLALLVPTFGTVPRGTGSGPRIEVYQIAFGAVFLLVGVTTVLPWIVDASVRRMRGGPISWQLATRRLQMSSGAAARMVNGVAVAVAGAIALQLLFAAAEPDYRHDTGTTVAQVGDQTAAADHGTHVPPLQDEVAAGVGSAAQAQRLVDAVASAKGVTAVHGTAVAAATQATASRPGTESFEDIPVRVADCATLRLTLGPVACRPGSVFVVRPGPSDVMAGELTSLRPGARVDLNAPALAASYTGTPRLWTIPVNAPVLKEATDPSGDPVFGILATPQAVPVAALSNVRSELLIRTDPHTPDAIEYVRDAAFAQAVEPEVTILHGGTESPVFSELSRGLVAGAALVLALIAASLLVMTLEQLRERRKLLAVLVAFGTRRSVLAWSVLWQSAILVTLGLAVACAGGFGLGAALLRMTGQSARPDWSALLTVIGIGGAVVPAVTLLSLPALWRFMRPDGLRAE
jgi:ABC-type antimicrobial peptide transport system permease subunit